MGLKKMLKRLKHEEKYEQPETVQQDLKRVFAAEAHNYFMYLPHSYFLRKGPNYEK